MRQEGKTPKTLRARELGVSRGALYYKPKKPEKDRELKCQIEEVLREHPSYGSPRISLALKRNHKPVERVMKIFGIKAYRRRGKRWKKTRNIEIIYPNLLLSNYPKHSNNIWVSDFAYIPFQGKTVYLATVMDLFTRKVVGMSVYTTHATQLVLSAFLNALHANPRPEIFHSDNGSEYNSEIFIQAIETVGTKISRSKPGCPWRMVIRNRSMINSRLIWETREDSKHWANWFMRFTKLFGNTTTPEFTPLLKCRPSNLP